MLKRAEEVRAKAVAGADFNALAREYSDDPSVTRPTAANSASSK